MDSRLWKKSRSKVEAIASIKGQKDKRWRYNLDASESQRPLLSSFQRSHPDFEAISILQRFPVELLFSVLDHLDDTSIVCLQYASRYFCNTIRIDTAGLSKCTKWLIMTRFELDNVPYTPKVKKVACALCKTRKKLSKFTGDSLSVSRKAGEESTCVVAPNRSFSLEILR